MRTGGLFQFMRFVCNLPRIMRLFDFGKNYAKNYASIIRQGLDEKLGLGHAHCETQAGCDLTKKTDRD